MAFDPITLVSTPNTWLETRVRYEGAARAEFTSPPGVIEGPATVCFDAAGACRVRIKVERIDASDPETFSLRTAGTLGTYLVYGEANPCSSLTVRTDSGVFAGGDRIIHDGLPPDAEQQVELRPIHSRFEVAGAEPAKYWVLPLANFMPDPWNGFIHPELANHPLRLRPTPTIPADLPEEDRAMAEFHVYHQHNLFSFLLNGEPGFIERMPDYTKRVTLVRHRRSRRITAVMVGPAHVQDVEWFDYEGLFPLDVVSALSLATGVPVGAPWVEFRDEKGALVRRVHICFGAGRYEQRHATLHPHLLRNGPGYVLGKVLAAPDRGKKYLRVAINHALSAAKRGTLEGRFISLCRAFETLCRHHGFINQNLAARLEPAQQEAVKTLLREVAGKVREMRNAEPDPGRKAVLDTIAGRAQSAAQTEKSFGLAVADLAGKFGFQDEQVLDAHLAAHPHHTGKPWPGILTHYRAAATHDAYFDFASREDLYTILRVMNHLHDLLLRVLLKTVGYDGPYQSPIPPLMQRDSLDWVTPPTAAGLLGYA
jgi:hypothetical protein